jgi:hypothetical protein
MQGGIMAGGDMTTGQIASAANMNDLAQGANMLRNANSAYNGIQMMTPQQQAAGVAAPSGGTAPVQGNPGPVAIQQVQAPSGGTTTAPRKSLAQLLYGG